MAVPVRLKRSGTAGVSPSSLEHGEVAINYADGKVFWKDASNVVTSFTFQSYALSSHTHAAEDITSGTVATARLGNGTADSSTFLRGDNQWASVISTSIDGGSATTFDAGVVDGGSATTV